MNKQSECLIKCYLFYRTSKQDKLSDFYLGKICTFKMLLWVGIATGEWKCLNSRGNSYQCLKGKGECTVSRGKIE